MESASESSNRTRDASIGDGNTDVTRSRAVSVPVSLAKVGETGIVVRISGNPEVRKFLSDLGFTIGTRISTVSDLKGNKILSVRGSRIAIDSTMASKILFCPE